MTKHFSTPFSMTLTENVIKSGSKLSNVFYKGPSQMVVLYMLLFVEALFYFFVCFIVTKPKSDFYRDRELDGDELDAVRSSIK